MKKVIAIVGPTGVGKTDVSIDIAGAIPTEIISGDSMQVYQGMDIGTGKVTESEKKGIPHHMIDIQEVGEDFSVATFKEMTEQLITMIHAKGKIPTIVGGTGLYIESVLYNFNFPNPKRDEMITEMLEKRLQNEGNHVLYNELIEVDEAYAKSLHPNNHQRLIRALGVYLTTGLTMSEVQKKQKKQPKYNLKLIGLEMDRHLLYDRINTRVDQMIEKGLLQEVASFYEQGHEDSQAMKAIGYKELIPVLRGEMSLESAVETLKRNSRRYAKRQFTYFKNKMDIDWYKIELGKETTVKQKIIRVCHDFFHKY